MEEEEIAIIGAGCRFPGADNLDEFWRVLVNGENHVRDIPESRWNNAAFYDEDPTVPGKTYVKKAGLLNSHDKWDNRLFGISEVEASRIDPQQRYVLECVHMAMEDGGLTRKQLSGSKTGVIIEDHGKSDQHHGKIMEISWNFVEEGCMNNDYSGMANYDLMEIGGYNATGTSTSVISARVSYVYNLHGTCLTLDTACSSALVAIHLASQAIRTGDCDMMICGGVNSILSPDIYIALCKARMMSATGQCQSFCETADGYARGEGCGIVILKGLNAAKKDGNKIWGVIKTGSNQDGFTAKPITAPSGDQQMKLLERVYSRFRFNPSDIQYIEAHGTGTPRGDPTELNALGKFFSLARHNRSERLLVGSVKSNIGHTESAAGIAGLLKVLLMMNNGKYVASLHIRADKSNVNNKIMLSEYGLDIPTNVDHWPCDKNGKRHACLNSFGFGGSNTHAIITVKEISQSKKHFNDVKNTPLPICISGVDQEALKLNLLQFHDDLDQPHVQLPHIAVTSFNYRDVFPYRTLVSGNDKKAIQRQCSSKAEKVSNISPKRGHNKIFVYCGVGTTWKGMCQKLMHHSEVFCKTIHEIDNFLFPLTNWYIADKFKEDTDYDDPFLNHIAIFSVQVGLTEVWKSYAIKPDKIIGQSVGEVAAAYAAEYVSLEEAVNIIYHRSLILAKQSEGAMSVVGNIDINQIEDMCNKYENKVCIAVYSSPRACTISGYNEEVNLLIEALKTEEKDADMFVRELKVKCAYHSPILDGCMDEITTKIDESLESLGTKTGRANETIPLLSTVTGILAKPDEMRTGKYWAMNIRQPVRFMQSIKEAFEEDKYNIYLEIGPRPVLKAHIDSIFESTDRVSIFPSMLVKKEIQCLYDSMSGLFEQGIDINISKLVPTDQVEITSIPRYVFNKTGELFIPNKCKAYMSGSKNGASSHLYVQTLKSVDETVFRILLDEESTPFVFEHYLSDTIIVPGATYIEAGFQIGQELLKKPTHYLSVGFNFVKTYTPAVGGQSELQVHIDYPVENNLVKFNVEGNENILANGSVTLRKKREKAEFDIDYIKWLCNNHKLRKSCYDALKHFNFTYGDSLSLIQGAWLSDSGRQCLVDIRLPEKMNKDLVRTHFHPAAIDCTFQIFGIIVRESFKDAFAVPKGVDSVVINRSLEEQMFGYAEEIKRTVNSTHYNAILMTASGTVIAEVENFYTRIITNEIVEDTSTEYELNWIEHDHQNDEKSIANQIVLFSKQPDSRLVNELKDVIQVTEKGASINDCLSKKNRDNRMSIIYHVGHGNERNIRQNVFDDTVERFTEVQKLLVSKDQADDYFDLTIITENTQACPERHVTNYAGSELWGMIRSAIHEGFYGRVKLIDIDANKVDISVLLSVITTKSPGDFEFSISGSTVYRSQVTSGMNFKKPSRSLSIHPSDVLSIHSTSLNCISSPYLRLTKIVKPKTKCVSVSVESFTIHNKSLYIPVVGDVMKSDHLLKIDQDDNQIVIVEGKGREQDEDKEVYFLYPVKAGTTVHIPKENIFETVDCPFFQSGILILMNFIVHITLAIDNGEKVAVFSHSDAECFGVDFLKHLLAKRQCNVRFVSWKIIQNEEALFEEKTLIFATASSIEYWNLIVKSFPHLRKVVTISTFMPENIYLWIKHNFVDISLKVIPTNNVLSTRKIAEVSQTIRNYLKEYALQTRMSLENNFILKLPMKTLELKKEIENRSLVCYCSPRNIFRSNAAYIVVGGLTGLGWELLQMMAEMGAKALITMSRRAPSDMIRQRIIQLQDTHGCRIVPMQVDICNIEDVKMAFSKIDINLPDCPIRGIFHGAGIVNDSLLQYLDLEKLKMAMEAKIMGAWNLHIASVNLSLDYFIIQSSIVSVLGNPGQCNYAAANSFLDSFAKYRRSLALPGQSINWGALDVGMAVETTKRRENLKQKGFNLVEKDKLRANFIEAIVTDSTNIVYADIAWERLLKNPTFALQVYKFNNFQNIKIGSKANVVNKTSRLDLSEFRKLDDEQKEAKVKDLLEDIVHLVLVAEKESLSSETRLTDIGIDSMAAMSLSNAIYDTFGSREPVVTLLSEDTTLSKLTRKVMQSFDHPSTNDDKTAITFSEDISEFKHIFESRNITFTQKDILDKCRMDRKNPYLLIVIDIEVEGHRLSLVEWKQLVSHSLKINPELRQRYHFSAESEDEVSVETLSDEDLPLNITEISIQDFCDSLNYDVREEIYFDIHNSLPVSIQVAESADKTMFRLIFHKVAFDMKSLAMFCVDMENTFEAYLNNKELPTARPYIDATIAMRETILPRMNELGSYWKNYLNCDIKPITFGPRLQKPNAEFCNVNFFNVPPSIVSKIRKYIAREGISLYEFIMSLYHLFLYIGSGSTLVTIGTAADLRYHVPKLNNVSTRCANYIPIVANINESESVAEFIKRNSSQISETTEHSAYPGCLIIENIKSSEMQEQVFRHTMSMNDMSRITGASGEKVNSIYQIRRILHSRPTRETFMYVQYDMKKDWIRLELGHNLKICGYFGSSFSNILLSLADKAIDGSVSCLKGLKEQWQTNAKLSEKEGVEMNGIVYAEIPSYHENTIEELMDPCISQDNKKEVEKPPLTEFQPKLPKQTADSNNGSTQSISCSKPVIPVNEISHINNKKTVIEISNNMKRGTLKADDIVLITEVEKPPLTIEFQPKLPKQMNDSRNGSTQTISCSKPVIPVNEIHHINDKKTVTEISNNMKYGTLKADTVALITGKFSKQTSHGWDHKVDVILKRDVDKRVVLEWGKDKWIRKKTNTVFDLNNVEEVVMRKINDLQTIIIVSNERKLILKTPDRKQAEQWMNEFQRILASR